MQSEADRSLWKREFARARHEQISTSPQWLMLEEV